MKPHVETEAYEGDDRRKWHVDKTINLGHLLTTITIAGALIGLWFKMDTRIALLEQSVQHQAQINNAHENTDKELALAIKEGFITLNTKLDRLIWERGGQK